MSSTNAEDSGHARSAAPPKTLKVQKVNNKTVTTSSKTTGSRNFPQRPKSAPVKIYEPRSGTTAPKDTNRRVFTQPAGKYTPKTQFPQTSGQRGAATRAAQHLTKSAGNSGDAKESCPKPEAVPLGLDVKLDRPTVRAVEVHTRGQSENPNWFSWRQNRITASTAHRVSHSRFVNGQSRTPPESYVTAILGEGQNVRTRAMTWGIEHEAQAAQVYQRLKSKSLGRAVKVQECGLFIDPQRAWLAASPDGIVEDKQTGEHLLCLEVKCPYKHRENTVRDACLQDSAFCLELVDQQYRLKTKHSYYTQVQCQMAVTGIHKADLVVFTLRETAVVPVTFDPQFWYDTVTKLEKFYREGVLPRLREKGHVIPSALPEE
ncbi:hypothetical protein AALO_G00201580 [Alosa alosa]|uniref:YqaJ viral recombinase domain-containing protein n=1 Tax=Alosa alosa TaxID=278164 RepID=A0AAV6G2V5_9TELE|nr:uncharacterized protein LOC125308262 [Alosa alosa]XP_048120598.1 uncharacterized protein LOC125308262 [Alosa alosa]KAG5269398.1 hypothetical protein AALO_G00201580 [Alosa alosa]